jgi:hypothetical protein
MRGAIRPRRTLREPRATRKAWDDRSKGGEKAFTSRTPYIVHRERIVGSGIGDIHECPTSLVAGGIRGASSGELLRLIHGMAAGRGSRGELLK